jgi:hypothetical protein
MAAVTPTIVLPAGYGYVFGGLFSTILSNVYLVSGPDWWRCRVALLPPAPV